MTPSIGPFRNMGELLILAWCLLINPPQVNSARVSRQATHEPEPAGSCWLFMAPTRVQCCSVVHGWFGLRDRRPGYAQRSAKVGHCMTFGRVALLVGVAVLVLMANVAASILYMVVYGYVIDPGHDPEYYDAHIQVAAPYCSTVAGIPLMFFAGWWIAGWWQRKPGITAALIVWLAYAVIDLAVILAVGPLFTVAALFVISFVTKFAAAYAGARVRVSSAVAPPAEAGVNAGAG